MEAMAVLCAGLLGFAATTIGHYAEGWAWGYVVSMVGSLFMLMAFNSES